MSQQCPDGIKVDPVIFQERCERMPELMQGEFRLSASNKGRFCNVRYAVRMLPLVKNTALFLYAECDKDRLESGVQRIPAGKVRF